MSAEKDKQDKRATNPSIAVLKWMDENEPVVQPSGQDQGVLVGIVSKEVNKAIDFTGDLFGWSVLDQ